MSYTRFIILGQERTGSTLLQMLLHSDKSVISMGEIFNVVESIRIKNPHKLVLAPDEDPVPALENTIFGDYPKSYRAVGFKLFYRHAQAHPWSRVWDFLVNERVKIIHQKRRNLLDRYLSLKLAEQTNQWILVAGRDKPITPDPITLDPHECFNDFYKTVWFYNWVDKLFADTSILEVYYEDLAGDTGQISQQVQDFLGLESRPLSTKMVKQRQKTRVDLISNYAEFKVAMKDLIESHSNADPSWMDFFRC